MSHTVHISWMVYAVVAALTKSSQNDTQRTSIMERSIRECVAQKLGSEGEQIVQKQLAVIPVCAVEKKLRSGTVTQPFGKEALARAVLDSWRVTVLGRLPSAVIERLKAGVKEFINGEIVALKNKEVSGNLDASMNREIVDGFYYRLNNFTNDLLQTKYSGIVLELIGQASDIETALMKAMSIPSNSEIASTGISHFRDEIKERVTGATWAGRIASFGIASIVGRFSSKAQGRVREIIEAQFLEGEKMTCDSIAAKKAQIEKDVSYLLAQGGAQ